MQLIDGIWPLLTLAIAENMMYADIGAVILLLIIKSTELEKSLRHGLPLHSKIQMFR